MDQHDKELLERQLRATYQSPPQPGIIILTILAIFVGGMVMGGLLSAQTTSTAAANRIALAFLDVGTPITRN